MRNENKYHERLIVAQKSTWISAVVNLFLSFTQIVIGFFSGSQGLIADGIHSLSRFSF